MTEPCDVDPATAREIRDAGLPLMRDFIAYGEEFLRLVQPWQQWDGEPPEAIMDRMPEPERTDALRLWAHLKPLYDDRRRKNTPPGKDT